MTKKPSLWTRIRHAVFGRPLSHEDARARHEADVARARSSAAGQAQSSAKSMQNQTWII
jgi:hypothetical protein